MTNLQPGQMIGAYRIVGQIGQGGMATVYRAYHASMDRYVAVKVLPTQFMEAPEFIGRFQQEARVIANLEHPHILPVYDYGEHERIPYFVMRYLDAGTLKERIQKGLSLAEVDRFFTQLAEAIGYAHEKGVIHRDIKPSNALVDARGDLFLTDFGIAKLVESAAQFTATGAFTGTPSYMSPEQAQGKKVDPRTDIYSLGIVLYEMVTGRVPFQAETPLAVVLQQIQAPLPLPSTVKPDLPLPVERVILKALAKEPEDRFATTGEFLAAWKQAYQEAQRGIQTLRPPDQKTIVAETSIPTLPRQTQPEDQPEPAPSVSAPRKWPVRWIAGGLVLLAIVALAAVFWPKPPGNEPENPPPTPNENEEAPGPLNLPPGWTSWTNGNTIYSVQVNGDEIYTGGPGGITVWNRADGTVLRRYTTADGLPDPRVNTIFVDDDGSLWVGTVNGLAHLEGEEWVVYNREDGLDSDDIRAIARVGENLLVGTQYSNLAGGGLNQFDGRSWSAIPDFPSANQDEQPDKLSTLVNVILAGEDGRYTVGTYNGLGVFDGTTWTRYSTDDGLPSNEINNLALVSDDTLLIGTNTTMAILQNEQIETVSQGPQYGVYGILEDLNGHYWFSNSGGLWEYNPANGNWEGHNQDSGELPVYNVFSGARDEEGNLYFGSEEGLIHYNGSQFTAWKVPNVPFAAVFGGIVAQPNGKLWFIEESGSTVSEFDPAAQTWSLFEPPCSCLLFAFDTFGNAWGMEWQNGYWVVTADGTATHYTEGIPPESSVWSIASAPDDTSWLGTENGLLRLEGTQVVEVFTTDNSTLNDNFARVLRVARDGSLWVATDRGLSRRFPDGQWEAFAVGNPFVQELPYIYDIEEGANGEIWVATGGQGVFRWEEGNWRQLYPGEAGVRLPSPHVWSITLAPEGGIWFGTNAGAAFFDGTTWQIFRTADGLIHPSIRDIYVHPSGVVWFATPGGITQYVPGE